MRLHAALLVVLASCGGSAKDVSTATEQDVELPGVDTSQFTPRERHEFSQFVRELPAPCKDVAVPVAQCVLEKRACAVCLPAAQASFCLVVCHPPAGCPFPLSCIEEVGRPAICVNAGSP